eukprot:1159623-Pelagomonas_calceolata.AAC.10
MVRNIGHLRRQEGRMWVGGAQRWVYRQRGLSEYKGAKYGCLQEGILMARNVGHLMAQEGRICTAILRGKGSGCFVGVLLCWCKVARSMQGWACTGDQLCVSKRCANQAQQACTPSTTSVQVKRIKCASRARVCPQRKLLAELGAEAGSTGALSGDLEGIPHRTRAKQDLHTEALCMLWVGGRAEGLHFLLNEALHTRAESMTAQGKAAAAACVQGQASQVEMGG